MREGQREEERKSHAGSALSAQSPTGGLELTNRETMTRADVGHLAERPHDVFFTKPSVRCSAGSSVCA